jgi:DNA-binding transcriptional regulator LsrR (DeoR family)
MALKIKNHHKTAALLWTTNECSKAEIGRKLGVSRQTVTRWFNDAGFQQLIASHYNPIVDNDRKEKQLIEQAYTTLKQVMEHGVNDGARVTAARYILDTFRVKKQKERDRLSSEDEIGAILKLVGK